MVQAPFTKKHIVQKVPIFWDLPLAGMCYNLKQILWFTSARRVPDRVWKPDGCGHRSGLGPMGRVVGKDPRPFTNWVSLIKILIGHCSRRDRSGQTRPSAGLSWRGSWLTRLAYLQWREDNKSTGGQGTERKTKYYTKAKPCGFVLKNCWDVDGFINDASGRPHAPLRWHMWTSMYA
jgi:hypothetical protein